MSQELGKMLADARELRRQDELEESQALLISLLEKYPENPTILFEVGGSFDVLGDTDEAISYYEDAIEMGLDGPDLQECMICLGISYRGIGNAQHAVEILEDAALKFPGDSSVKAFLALSYYSNEQYSDAVQLLLELILNTTSDEQILAFADTLEYYKENLDEVWSD